MLSLANLILYRFLSLFSVAIKPNLLSRRLQTLTYLKGLANTPNQARQLVIHGHIAIGNRKITVPSYMVSKDEENEIGYTPISPLKDTLHPARPNADFKPISNLACRFEARRLKSVEDEFLKNGNPTNKNFFIVTSLAYKLKKSLSMIYIKDIE